MKQQFKDLKDKISKDLDIFGSLQPVPRYKPLEVLNYFYEFDHNLILKPNLEDLKYVEEKLVTYKDQIDTVLKYLRQNKYNRQAIIQFEQKLPLPNCTVSIQFQIRNDEVITSVFQRSQDLKKTEMDCEIFRRLSLIVSALYDIDKFQVKVFVGNMHKFLYD